jgi:hypothetical protein
MFHLDETGHDPHVLRLARVTLDRSTLWSWLCQYPPTEELGSMLKTLPPDDTLHDILFTRHGVTFVLRTSSFPEVKPGAPVPWLSSVCGEERPDGHDAQA